MKSRGAFWWIDRWRKSTAYTDMTLAEQAAYRNLLDELWLRDGVLPADERILAKVCGDALSWPEVRKAVMARFVLTPEGYRNETHDEVAAGAKNFHTSQAEKGRKGARERWDRERKRKGGMADSCPGDGHSHGPSDSRGHGPAISPASGPPMASDLRSPYTHTHTTSEVVPTSGPPDDAGVSVCDGLSPSPNQSPAHPGHAAQPAPPPDDDDLDAHLQATWNRLRAELHRAPPERFGPKHRDAWTWLLEACESNVAECEAVIRGYLEWRIRFLVDAGWSINVFTSRAGAVLMRLRDQKAKRLRVVEKPTEPEPVPASPEAAEAALRQMRELTRGIGSKAVQA